MGKITKISLSGQSVSSGTFDILVTCRDGIVKAISDRESPTEIIEHASKELPELKKLSDLLPKTRTEAYAFITILIVLLNFVIDNYHKLKLSDVKQTIVNQTIQNFYYLKNPSSAADQQASHIEKKKQRQVKNYKSKPKKTNKKATQ